MNMPWQDVVATTAVWLSAYGLVPAMRGHEKPPLATSVISTVAMVLFTVVYISKGWWGAVASATVLTVFWAVLAFQKWRGNRRFDWATDYEDFHRPT